jgi:hypothetical protein
MESIRANSGRRATVDGSTRWVDGPCSAAANLRNRDQHAYIERDVRGVPFSGPAHACDSEIDPATREYATGPCSAKGRRHARQRPWQPAPGGGEMWNGAPFTGASYTVDLNMVSIVWAGAPWPGTDWRGSHWRDHDWSGAHWRSGAWEGSHWREGGWEGAHWRESAWVGSHWRGAHWRDLSWS